MPNEKPKKALGFSLSAKLLVLTTLFIMLAEILIFLPSVANFRVSWLEERLSAAHIAALAVQAAPNNQVPEKLRIELLNRAGVYSVALKKGNQRNLILQSPMPHAADKIFDIRSQSFLKLIFDAMKVYFEKDDILILVTGQPEMSEVDFIEVLMLQGPLKKEMISFAINIFVLSLLISIFTAALVYLTLNYILVRPIGQLTENMMKFSENPEDPDRKIIPSDRRDEIGTVERELEAMQTDLSTMLKQKSRLANLGVAVSKINHDLRGMLGTAQLVSDRLSGVDDPTVQKVTPRLVRSIDRAIKLCTDTLQYGKAEEQGPKRALFNFKNLIEEVLEEQGLPKADVQVPLNIKSEAEIYGDYEQLYRVFTNIIRNAIQVIEANKTSNVHDKIMIDLVENGAFYQIDIIDSGPGLPEKAKEHLFEPFRGSLRKGGTGLGLAIAAEILRAHNGRIDYRDNSSGAHFQIHFPKNGNGNGQAK